MKNGFVLYKGMYQPIKDLPNEKFGKLMKAIFEYQENGNELELDMDLKIAFGFFKNQFDIDNKKYLEICKKRQEQGKKGGLAKASKSYQKVANSSKSSLKDKDKDKDKEKNIKEEAIRFIEFWNKLFNKNHKATDDFINTYISKRKKYSKEDIVKGIQAYHLKNKNNLNDEWYNNYYLVPLKFIKQSNGFISYL